MTDTSRVPAFELVQELRRALTSEIVFPGLTQGAVVAKRERCLDALDVLLKALDANQRLRQQLSNVIADKDEARTELERLREALTRIAEWPWGELNRTLEQSWHAMQDSARDFLWELNSREGGYS